MVAGNIQVETKGKLFEKPGPIVDYHIGLMTRELADQAETAIKFQGQTSFRYEKSLPTGKWRRSIKTRQARDKRGRYASGWIVSDSGIVYGPWLEGVSPRNQTTRFKGYSTFRKVRQEIERKAPRMLIRDTKKMADALERP